jgi:hypothetical protein
LQEFPQDLWHRVATVEDLQLISKIGDADAKVIDGLPILELERIKFAPQRVRIAWRTPSTPTCVFLSESQASLVVALLVMLPRNSEGTPSAMASRALQSSMKSLVTTFTAIHKLLAIRFTHMSATHA